MADSLLAKLGDLTFTAEEQDAIVVAPDAVAIPAEDFASSLVGKVVSPPTIYGSRLIRQFRSIWKDDKVLNISEINLNFFLISFASPANRTNVLKRGPWDFQKYWFALEQADPNRTIHDYSFLHMCIWVRIHNIPLSLMTAALARVLGASISKVIMTDTRPEDANMGEFMRPYRPLCVCLPDYSEGGGAEVPIWCMAACPLTEVLGYSPPSMMIWTFLFRLTRLLKALLFGLVSALFAGLEFAIASGWASALIESDAAVLVNKLHHPTMDLSLLGDLLAPSRAMLTASNGCLRVGFAPRSVNSAAHALASWACHNDNVISFSSVCPDLISRIVLDDLSSSF
ncbi:hypothetical protein GQ457_11G028030 [Hibiscus cannabinus]